MTDHFEVSQQNDPRREALEQIAALAEQAERISPPVSIIGHPDPWAEAGKRAVKIAREALEAGE